MVGAAPLRAQPLRNAIFRDDRANNGEICLRVGASLGSIRSGKEDLLRSSIIWPLVR